MYRCKWDVTLEYLTRAIFEKQLKALHVVHTFHLFNRYVFTLLTKMRAGTKTVPSTWYISNVHRSVFTHWFSHICLILLLAYIRNQRTFIGKSEALLSWLAICLLFWWFISHRLVNYANINTWTSDYMKAWNSIKNDCGHFVKYQMQRPLH